MQGVKSMTADDAAKIQATDLGSHTRDLYDAIERGDFPEWELNVQIMDDHDHPDLDWVNAPRARVATNQRDGQMAYAVNLAEGASPHANYEPSITGGLREAAGSGHSEQGPEISGRLTRKRISRTNDYQQADERYLLSDDWERDDLVANLVGVAEPVRPAHPGADGLASVLVRGRVGAAGGRRTEHLRRRCTPAGAPTDPVAL